MSGHLVIGASGQVGEHCLAALPDAVGTFHRHERPGLIHLDVNDPAELARVMEQTKPRSVVFAAAQANVDACEADPGRARHENVVAIERAVELCNRFGSKLVFLSSEYLFDGVSGPYGETAPANPLSVYGVQKLIAEHFIAAFANDWLVVRTAGVYGPEKQGKNFVCRLVRTLRAGETMLVPFDQRSTPTYAPDLAMAIAQLVARDARGVFNVAGPRQTSRYDFAIAAARAFALCPGLLTPVATAELGQKAPRPLNAGLRVEKAERVLGRTLVDYERGLEEMARRAL